MRLSVSALAWPATTDPAFLAILRAHGIGRIDLVPTLVWPDWDFGSADVTRLRADLGSAGIACTGMQSIFFRRPEFNVFAGDVGWRRTRRHLARVARLAGALGIGPVVFGSPANRDPGPLPPERARRVALRRFRSLGPLFAAEDAVLCLEPVPTGPFLRDHAETAAFVREAAVPGLGMVLDTAALTATAKDPSTVVASVMDVVAHVHASEPNLGNFALQAVDHAAIGAILRRQGYAGTVALEMAARDDIAGNLERALGVLVRDYGGA